MNGAKALTCANTTKMLSSSRTTTIGASQNFLRAARNPKISFSLENTTCTRSYILGDLRSNISRKLQKERGVSAAEKPYLI